MRIAHNIAGMNTSRNQGMVKTQLGKSLEKLSSGYRIVRAGDDAAGLAISEEMRSQIAGLDQAMRNAEDGVGMVNTGEGALQEVHAMLHRLETLAIESANGTFNDVARENVDLEKKEIMEEWYQNREDEYSLRDIERAMEQMTMAAGLMGAVGKQDF